MNRQKAPSNRRCIKTEAGMRVLSLVNGSESTQHQKRLFTGFAVRWLPTVPENGQSDRQSLEQALRADEPPRHHRRRPPRRQPRPPPQRDSCQVSSRDSRERHAAETPLPREPVKQTHTKAGGPEKLGIRPLTPTRHPPTSGQAVRRPAAGPAAQPSRPARHPRFRCGAGAGR